ncbi:DUF5658 family protein [Natrinema versiforme]|uniref:DUF5658 domain-containing protein n=1 Tax=Natrinema versiforme JCM 10478 TaxID=1227496 RepID=L9Y5C9_9EURY|nr:DUF5658 family protein [Natrinema versiforme]ELY68866.1 hypothetical protein C489_05853 [Natrinema versiforme JCM 10478]
MTEPRTITLEIPIPQPTLEHALWALVAVAIALDALTTQVGLANGLSESNPSGRAALEYGALGFVALKGAAVGVGLAGHALLRWVDRPTWGLIAPGLIAAVWLGAALWNLRLLAEIGVVA